MFTSVMTKSFTAVMLMTAAMSYIVYSGHFTTVTADLGHQHYAEKVLESWKPYLPKSAKLPFNTIVNVGYVIVGAAWCAVASVTYTNKGMLEEEALLLYVFSFLSCSYGPIQALRILSQLHGFAVLDQWYTLPFFMWVLIWGLYFVYGWSSRRAFMLMFLSLSSFTWTLFHEHGFEASLGIHIVLASVGACIAWRRHPQAKVLRPFIGALVSCAGFVILKLLDHELGQLHNIFAIFSGHFLSKCCDILQIHFICKYFLAITFKANMDRKKKKE